MQHLSRIMYTVYTLLCFVVLYQTISLMDLLPDT